ncbi:ORF6N domain-containing protein [Candidatus Gracilibacteria bacterium]|nr:ORF6N domain-containing protein [Candidatus Gracilibacteria bacterium]
MKNSKKSLSVADEIISQKIYVIRGRKVMLDKDLAELYGVETKVLNQAVKRNSERFPNDFMIILTQAEVENLRSQFVTSKIKAGGSRYLPCAFTEQGIAMLSSVLHSERAIQINIQIMRMFTKLRELLEQHKDLRVKIEELERKYDKQFQSVFFAIKRLLSNTEKEKSKRRIGFNLSKK